MKAIFFSLSLLLLLEKQAAGIGVYGGVKGQFVVKTFPYVVIQKDQYLYGSKGAQEEAGEESIFVQTKQHANGQEADLRQTKSSREQTGLNEDIDCDEEDGITQQKPQIQSQSQIKSQVQIKSHGAQLKSQTGQLKSLGQPKSQVKLKFLGTPLKSFKAPLNLQEDVPQQIKAKGYAQVRQQPKSVLKHERKSGWFMKTAEFQPYPGPQSQAYNGYLFQFQEQPQYGVQQTKSFHQAQGTCYCPNGGVILYQSAFAG